LLAGALEDLAVQILNETALFRQRNEVECILELPSSVIQRAITSSPTRRLSHSLITGWK
jgi:hypothetical protein